MTASPVKASPSPPLRFLAVVIGGWICVRAIILLPGAGIGPVADARRTAAPPVSVARAAAPAPVARPPIETPSAAVPRGAFTPNSAPRLSLRVSSAATPLFTPRISPASSNALPQQARASDGSAPAFVAREAGERTRDLSLPPLASAGRRWSGSAWLLARRDSGGASLAPGGTLGGSQAGARILYRVGRGLALSGRAYAPLLRPKGAELAAGLDWRPAAAIPINIQAERREAVGREGRSAFSITAYGGMTRALGSGLRLDAYAEAGIVGLKARDAFADGAVRLSVAAGPVEIGGGAWGAAQPGASRLDAGPSLSYRLPVAGAHLRLQADWRLRVAGDAAPGSGPALTLAADF